MSEAVFHEHTEDDLEECSLEGFLPETRILIIEDNRDAADSLRDLLEIMGYSVNIAYQGDEGVRQALQVLPHVVLCDIGLPGMDGYQVAKTLKNTPSLSQSRLIAITGYGGEEDRRLAYEAGFEVHITKPLDPSVLLNLLTASRRLESD